MFNLGTGELLIIFLVILLLFGAKKLPELARGLGKGINEFKDAVETGKQEIMDANDVKNPGVGPTEEPWIGQDANVVKNPAVGPTKEP